MACIFGLLAACANVLLTDTGAPPPSGPAVAWISVDGNIIQNGELPEFSPDDGRWRGRIKEGLKASDVTLALGEFKASLSKKPPWIKRRIIRSFRRVSMSFEGAHPAEVFRLVGWLSGVPIRVSSEYPGRVSVRCRNAPVDQLVGLLCKSMGFVALKHDDGAIEVIHPDDLLKEMETRVFPVLQKANLFDPHSVQEADLLDLHSLKCALEKILSRDSKGSVVGRLDYDPGSGAFVVVDKVSVLENVQPMIDALKMKRE